MEVCLYLHTLYTILLVQTVVPTQQEETEWLNTTIPGPSVSFPHPARNSSTNTPSKIPLYLIGLFPMSGGWPGGPGVLPAVELAIEDINKRTDILPGYELILDWGDTECTPGLGIKVLCDRLYSAPTKIVLLGGGCSWVTEPVARAATLWNLVQVSYSAISPALSNKADFPYFLRVQSPENLVNPVRLAIMKRYNWTRVASIHEPLPIFSKDIDDLRLRLAVRNLTLISSHIISENPALQIQSLKQDDARIIVVAAYEKKLVAVICEAYKAGMYGHRYVWLLADWHREDWPQHSFSDIDCTPDQIYAVIRPSGILLRFPPVGMNQRSTRGIAGMTPSELMKRYYERTDNREYAGTTGADNAYDTVWAVALGLNRTAMDLQGSDKGLEDFTYSDKDMGDLILKNIWAQKFLGISGDVFFDENGDYPRDVQISQFRGTKKHAVGIYSQKTDHITMYDNIGISWEGGIPKDATTFRTVHVFVSRTVYISVCCCASVGMMVAVAFLVFNIYFRKLRIIKMSSPVMNNVILLGCIVVYSTVFLQELSANNVALLCKLRIVAIMVGFSMSFGALFSKTWRVYLIFTNTTKRVVLRDYQLLLIVGVLVLIDLTAFVLREGVDTPRVVNTVLEKEILNNGDLVVEKEVMACYSDYKLYFEASVMAYKGILLIFGAFLAFQTRKVNIRGLNDSQLVGMCVYNVTILSIVGVVLVFALQNQVVLSYALVSAFIIFATTIVQLTIFIPKVLKVYHANNQIEEADDSTASTIVANKPTSTVSHIGSSADLEGLKQELTTTKIQLHEATEGLQELRQELENVRKQLLEAKGGQQELKRELERTRN